MAEKRRSLTFYHVCSNIEGTRVTEFDQVFSDLEGVEVVESPTDLPFEAKLFVSVSDPRLPSWVDFLKEGFAELDLAETRILSAVLMVKIHHHRDQFFAFTFGQGRHLLRPDSYDRNYGLRVALNVIYEHGTKNIDPDRLRSVDAKTVAENTIRTRRQTDKWATFETFGIDIQRDLLRAVTGSPIVSDVWGTRISGSDSLSVNPILDFQDLGEFCKTVAKTYRKDTYQENFNWIDNLRAVTDLEELDELNNNILERIIRGDSGVEISVPDIIEWGHVSGFRFSFDRDNTFIDPDDVDLHESLSNLNLLDELSLVRMKHRYKLEALSGEGDILSSWSLSRCLTCEIEVRGKTYLYSEGEFFEVEKNFLYELDNFIRNLPEDSHYLPDSLGDITEGEYNETAASSSASFLLLDKRTVSVSGFTTPIEICDILTDAGCFIHVKRKLGSSALSHLFAQGSVSADLFLMNRDYRIAVINKIREQEEERANVNGDPSFRGKFSDFPVDLISPGDFEVNYAIVARWKNRPFAKALPFFSKVNLRRHVEDLRRMGFKTSVARVNVVDS